MKYVDFDPDWYAIGMLEPEFVEEQVGWYTEEIVIDEQVEAGWIEPLYEIGSYQPIGYFKHHRRGIVPKPRYETVLKWKIEELTRAKSSGTDGTGPS